MLKYISKKVIRRNSGSNKAEEGSKTGTSNPPISFEFNDLNVARFSDLLEVTVRTKLTDQSGDPLSYVDDETTSNLVKEFGDNKVVKADFESYSASTLWSAAIQIINMNERILSGLKCDTLKSASYDDVVVLASSLSLPCQKLLGVIFAATEMLIRDEPSCAPMVLNQLANTIVWSLPPSTFVTTNALVNLLVEHRKLFPSCHTFARKISTTYKPVEPEEWRSLAANSVAIYGSGDADTGAGAAQGQSQKGPLSMELPSDRHGSDSAPASAQDADTKRSTGHTSATGTNNTSTDNSAGNKGKAWRSAFTEDLPLNDLNASVSIDVSARLEEQRGAGNNTKNNNSNSNSAGTKSTNAVSGIAGGGDVKSQQLETGMTIRQLQEVFGSSLVSAASLDYLSISNIIDEDYADTKTLSGTIKWILHSQELSDLVTKSKQKGSNKGIISWADFTALAEPFLAPTELQYLRTNKVAYDTKFPAASTSPAAGATDSRAESKHSGEVGNNNTNLRNSMNAGRKDSRSRSRKGFQQDSDSDNSDGDGSGGETAAAPKTAASGHIAQALGQGRAQNKQQYGGVVGSVAHNKGSTGAGRGSYYDTHTVSANTINTSALSDQISEVDELELQDSNSPDYRHTGTASKNTVGPGRDSGSGGVSTSINSLESNDSSEGGHFAPSTNNNANKQSNRYGTAQAGKHATTNTNMSKNRNTHSALDLLDESAGSIPSIPQMHEHDRSMSMSEHSQEQSQEQERNSFDDDSDTQSDPGEPGKPQDTAVRTTGPAPSHQVPSSQFVDNSTLLANSFDEQDSEHDYEQQQHRRSTTAGNAPALPPDVDLQSVHSSQQGSVQGSVSDLNTTGNTSVNKKGKGKVHKLMKMFHLTSTSTSASAASVTGSTQGSLHSSSGGGVLDAKQGTAPDTGSSNSPQRSRKDSIESVASALSTSTLNTDGSSSGVKKHKSMFGRLKAAVVGSKHKQVPPSVDVGASASASSGGGSSVVDNYGESGKMSSLGASVESLPSSDGMQDTPLDSPVSPPIAGYSNTSTAPSAAAPASTAGGNMRYSIGIADTLHPPSAGDSALPTAAGASGARAISTNREVRSETVRDDGSVASGQSGSTTDTLNTGDSTKKKKKSLKGRIAKKFKSVFGSSSGASGSSAGIAGITSGAAQYEEGKHSEPDASSASSTATPSASASASAAPQDTTTAATTAAQDLTAVPPPAVTPPAKPAKKPTFASVVAKGIFGSTAKQDDKGAAAIASGAAAATTNTTAPAAPPKPAKSAPSSPLQHRPLPATPGVVGSSAPAVVANTSVPAVTDSGPTTATSAATSATVQTAVSVPVSVPAAPITATTTGGGVASPPKPRKPSLSGATVTAAGGNTTAADARPSTQAATPTAPTADSGAGASAGIAGPGERAAVVTSAAPGTNREVRSETLSDDGSVASGQSGSTTDTLNTGDSTKKKKKSLKGRIAKKFKSVFGSGSGASGSTGAGAASTSDAAGIASNPDHHTAVPHHMPAGPSIYQPLTVDTTAASAHRPQSAYSSAASSISTTPTQQPQLQVQSPVSSASQDSTSTPTSTVDGPALTAALTPPPSAQSTDAADVITAGRKLSNPALKRSSFKLSSLFSFKNLTGSSKGSNPSSANNSRANSRSNSFSGIENAGVGVGAGTNASAGPAAVQQDRPSAASTPTTPTAASAGTQSTPVPTSVPAPVTSAGSRSTTPIDQSRVRSQSRDSHQSRDSLQLAPPRNRNGLGLAALLRSTLVPSDAAEGALSPNTVHSPPQSPGKRRHSLQGALSSGASVRTSTSLPAGGTGATAPSATQERYNALLARSRNMTADLFARLPDATHHSAPRSVTEDLERIRMSKKGNQRPVSPGKHGPLGHAERKDRAPADAQEQARQQELVLEWKSIMQRRAPLSMRMSKEQVAELRAVVTASASKDQQKDSPTRLNPHEDRAHKQLKRQMSQVADPLFGLSLQGSAQTNRLSRVIQHPSAAGGASGPLVSVPHPAAVDQLSPAEIDRVIADNLFHSELDLALGTKYAGELQRVSARMWRSRYFVLMVEPQVNPNLSLQGPVNALTRTPSTRSMALSVDGAGSNPQAAVSYGYYLLEYSKGVASQWGTVPVKLLKRYPIRNIVSLKTDSRPSKHGLEFTIVFERAEDPASVVDTDVPQTGAPNPVTHKTMRDIVKQTQPGNKFANVVLQQQRHHKLEAAGIAGEHHGSTVPAPESRTAAGPASAHPTVPAAANGASAAPAAAGADNAGAAPTAEVPEVPAVAADGLPVIKTRWNRLFQKSATAATSTDKISTAADTAPAAGPSQQPQAASTTALPATTAAPTNAAGTTLAGPEQESDSDDAASDNERDVASSVADFESQVAEGDYFYRQGTFDGKNSAVVGGKVDRKLYIKLRLKAATPDERLQWVQIVNSVASPAMYTNTLSY